jgi:hypothetical protein
MAHWVKKVGRGSKTKSNVMVMAESTVLENLEIGKVSRHCRYFKAKVLEDHQTEGTDDTLKKAIDDEKTIVFTDKSTSMSTSPIMWKHTSVKSRTSKRQRKHSYGYTLQ